MNVTRYMHKNKYLKAVHLFYFLIIMANRSVVKDGYFNLVKGSTNVNIPSFDILPSTGNTGDLAIEISTNSLSFFDGAKWNIISSSSKNYATALDWKETPGPIYNPEPFVLDEDYFPCVLYDVNNFSGAGISAKYKMWTQGSPGDALAVSYSYDGINWHLIGDTNLPAGASYHPVVLYDVNSFGGIFKYKIWYWSGVAGTNISVCEYAESNDGVTWVNIQSITQGPPPMVVTGIVGDFFYHFYGPGSVLYNPSATSTPGKPLSYPYAMYYDISTEGQGPGSNIESIGLAFSTDGKAWQRYGIVPVLIPTGSGPSPPSLQSTFEWDASYSFGGRVILEDNGIYHMYYSGSNQNINDGLVYAHGIGHAVSRDGVTWAKDPFNPVFYYNNGENWRSGRTYVPSVLYGTFDTSGPKFWKMWFNGGLGAIAGQNQGIGYAELR